MKTQWWTENLSAACTRFQLDLSCLIDGELDESAGWGAMRHIEGCECCRDFFNDARRQVQLHRDVSNPDQLIEHFTLLTGQRDVESVELIHKLATIFYQVGKAYVLSATDPDFQVRAFEKSVEVEATKSWGRGFVDGILARESGSDDAGIGFNWKEARHMLNGRLSKIEGALEKGKRLLLEALQADPTHDEARLYLGFVLYRHENKQLAALGELQRVFDEAADPVNRGHAANHLAKMYRAEGDRRRAIFYLRWIVISGLLRQESRFFAVRFNLGMDYAYLGNQERALAYWRELLDRCPERREAVVGFFANAPKLRAQIDSQPGFGEALMRTCPELFDTENDATINPNSDTSSEMGGLDS